MTTWETSTAGDIAAAVREGRAVPRQVVADRLARIERLDGRIGAFRTVRAAAALAEADAVAARPDLDRLPLAGVPVAVKDNVPVRGEATRSGSAATSAAPASADHPAVARLRAAGAVVVGLTNVPELCVFPTTDGPYGTARNPWDLRRTAGGSSGGGAAAVAAGLVPLALGNDGLGSLRIPAANCGVVGFRAGHGAVPSGLGASSWFGMAENGPLAGTAEDARLMYAVLAGEPAQDPAPASLLRVALSVRSPMPGLRVAGAWTTAVEEAAKVLTKAGHEVVPAEPPYPAWLGAAALARWTAGTAEDAAGLDPALLAPRTRRHAAAGRLAARAGLLRTDHRARLRAVMDPFFERYDVLLTPALARRGPLAADSAGRGWADRGWLPNLVDSARYAPMSAVWNIAGWPALSVPFGRLGSGAPCAVQLVGRSGSEHRLLDLVRQIEELRPWTRLAPVG
ncbi:amidase [Streptomyces sp. NPDC060194]|uniref:amidase n=1 Tax=Streptomyces sp. NPDC060194 TaxID=3347069 RepID=UPI003666578B